MFLSTDLVNVIQKCRSVSQSHLGTKSKAVVSVDALQGEGQKYQPDCCVSVELHVYK